MKSIQTGTVVSGAIQILTAGFSRARAEKGVINVSRMVLGFLLSRAIILGGLSPFGVAFIASTRGGASGLFALLGSLLGYLLMGFDNGLRYMAVTVLVFCAGTVFRTSRLYSKAWFMPAVAFGISGVTGIIYWAAQGAEALPFVLLITELLLTAGAAYLFGAAFPQEQEVESSPQTVAGRLLLASCVLLPLSAIEIGILSPARIAAVCVVMLLSFRTGTGGGAGVCMGLVMDLGLGAPFYSMSYGVSGLFSGIFRRAGKLWTALAFVGAGAVAALWAGDSTQRLSVMLEFFIASVIFLVIPDRAFRNIAEAVPQTAVVAARTGYSYVKRRLNAHAAAFSAIHQELGGAVERAAEVTREGIEVVFDRTSKQVCQRCLSVSKCWDYEQAVTFTSIREAAALSEKRGWVERGDFPPHFSTRCVHFKRFVETANRELTAMLYRRQYTARVNENREQLCRQYAEFGRVLAHAATETELIYDSAAEKRLLRYLNDRDIQATAEVCEIPGGRMCAQIEGENLSVLLTDKRAFTRDVSRVLGWLVNEPDAAVVASLNNLTLWETEPMTATLGVAAHKRDGQSVSGDMGAYFKTDDGKLYIVLSDGMGSGPEAAYDSRQAVALLEKQLKAGIHPESALGILNSALCVKSADNSFFVTIDLLSIDMLTGQLVSYKLGASPTYIRRGNRLRKISSTALPAGIDPAQKLEAGKLQLDGGDWIVLITDGISDSENDKWLAGILERLTDADSPRDLAARILSEAMRTGGASDDMTVLALKTEATQTRV